MATLGWPARSVTAAEARRGQFRCVVFGMPYMLATLLEVFRQTAAGFGSTPPFSARVPCSVRAGSAHPLRVAIRMATPASRGPARVWQNGHPFPIGCLFVRNNKRTYQRRVATLPNASGAAKGRGGHSGGHSGLASPVGRGGRQTAWRLPGQPAHRGQRTVPEQDVQRGGHPSGHHSGHHRGHPCLLRPRSRLAQWAPFSDRLFVCSQQQKNLSEKGADCAKRERGRKRQGCPLWCPLWCPPGWMCRSRRKMCVWSEGSSAGGSIVKFLNISAAPFFRLLGAPHDVRVKRGRLCRRIHS